MPDKVFLLSPLLLLIGLILLGGLVGMVVLLANRKTRVVGLVFLAIGLMTVLLGGGLLFSYKMVRQSEQQQQHAVMVREQAMIEMQHARRALDEGIVQEITIEDNVRPKTTDEATAAEEEAVAEIASDEEMALTATAETDTPPDEPDAPSTEPAEEPTAAEQRPAWVDTPPARVGDVYQTAVTVGPYISRLECDAKLPDALSEALQQYTATTIGPSAAGRIVLPPDFLTEQLVAEQWQETVQTSFGPMIQLHVLTRFDAPVQQRIASAWKQAVITRRLWLAGIGLSSILGFLAILFVGLKVTRRSDSEQPTRTESHHGTPQLSPLRATALIVLITAGASMLIALLRHGNTSSVGPIELLFLACVIGGVLLAVVINRSLWPRILGHLGCFVVATFCTPADPASTLLVFIPLSFVYTMILFLWQGSRSRPQSAPHSVAERTGT